MLVFDQTGSPLATAALFIGMHFLPAFLSQGSSRARSRSAPRSVLPALYLGEAVIVRGARAHRRATSRSPLVVALAIVDGTLAIAARAFTRAVGRGGADAVRPAAPGQRHHQRRLHRRGRAGPAIGGLVGRRPRRARPRCCWTPHRSSSVAATLALARSLPQVKAQARAMVERACARDSHMCAGTARCGRLLAMQAAAFIFFTAVIPIEIVYAKDTLGAGRLGLRRAAVGLGRRDGGREPRLHGVRAARRR